MNRMDIKICKIKKNRNKLRSAFSFAGFHSIKLDISQIFSNVTVNHGI